MSEITPTSGWTIILSEPRNSGIRMLHASILKEENHVDDRVHFLRLSLRDEGCILPLCHSVLGRGRQQRRGGCQDADILYPSILPDDYVQNDYPADVGCFSNGRVDRRHLLRSRPSLEMKVSLPLRRVWHPIADSALRSRFGVRPSYPR